MEIDVVAVHTATHGPVTHDPITHLQMPKPIVLSRFLSWVIFPKSKSIKIMKNQIKSEKN